VLIAPGVPTKVVVIIENQDLFFWSVLLPEKYSGSKTAEARTHYNQIIMFICLVGVSDTKSAIPGALMCGGIGTRMAPSQARQAWWIGEGFCCLGNGMESACQRASNGRSRSVYKVSAIDVAHNKPDDYGSLTTGTIVGEQSSLYGLHGYARAAHSYNNRTAENVT
jgi:hypothetical protein